MNKTRIELKVRCCGYIFVVYEDGFYKCSCGKTHYVRQSINEHPFIRALQRFNENKNKKVKTEV